MSSEALGRQSSITWLRILFVNRFRAIALFVPGARVALVLMTNGDGQKVNLEVLAIKLKGILLGRNWSQVAWDPASGNDGDFPNGCS